MSSLFLILPLMIAKYLSLVKFSHTIFALPFAVMGTIMGLSMVETMSWSTPVLILACMVFARSAAMSFNRYVDRDIDAKNPRTETREIPAGVVSPGAALTFVIMNCVAFILCAFAINPICGYLSPIALAVVLLYSYTKRFTSLCHLVLGLGLAIAPMGAYMAVTGEWSWLVALLSLVVLTWVAGFDIIYALQDDEFDRRHRLHSIPTAVGRPRALSISRILHLLCAVALIGVSILLSKEMVWWSIISWMGTVVFILALIYQHRLVSSQNLSMVNRAFFTTNGVASIVLGSCWTLDYFI